MAHHGSGHPGSDGATFQAASRGGLGRSVSTLPSSPSPPADM
jgi:acid stress chaperone HdeB